MGIPKMNPTVMKLWEEGLTNDQIIRETGLKRWKIQSMLTTRNLKTNRYVKVDYDKVEQLLIGSYLGDGSYTKREKGRECRLSLSHSTEQAEYFMYKFNKLKENELASSYQRIEYITETGKAGSGLRTRTTTHPIFSKFRDEGYENGDFYINMSLVENISQEGFSIWFFDDGNVCNDGLVINCKSVPFEEKSQLKDIIFRKFALIVNVTPDTLYIPKNQLDTFRNIVEPFTLESMKYKTIPYKLRAE